MTPRRIGLILGPLVFAGTVFMAPPAGMPEGAWLVAGLVVWMAAWWMTEAIPLTATALLPFVVLPFAGVSSARETASNYYSPILFLILGGAFIALAIERTGLHRRLSLAILRLVGASGGQARLLLAFMISAALLSMLISNTSTSLIMMPMALAVLAGGGSKDDDFLVFEADVDRRFGGHAASVGVCRKLARVENHIVWLPEIVQLFLGGPNEHIVHEEGVVGS